MINEQENQSLNNMGPGLLISMMKERGFESFEGNYEDYNGDLSLMFYKYVSRIIIDSIKVRCGENDFDFYCRIESENKYIEKKNLKHYDAARFIVEEIKKI